MQVLGTWNSIASWYNANHLLVAIHKIYVPCKFYWIRIYWKHIVLAFAFHPKRGVNPAISGRITLLKYLFGMRSAMVNMSCQEGLRRNQFWWKTRTTERYPSSRTCLTIGTRWRWEKAGNVWYQSWNKMVSCQKCCWHLLTLKIWKQHTCWITHNHIHIR